MVGTPPLRLGNAMQDQPDSPNEVVNSLGEVETPDKVPAAPHADPATFHPNQTAADLGAIK